MTEKKKNKTLEEIFKQAQDGMSDDRKKYITQGLIDEIKREFMYLIKHETGRYWLSFPNALKWLDDELEGDKLYEKRNNFKKRVLNNTEFTAFKQARDEDDEGWHYIYKDISPEKRAEKKGKNEPNVKKEIVFSTDGFKLFCLDQNKNKKAQAVWLYFIQIEKDYYNNLHAEHADIIKQRDELESKLKIMKELKETSGKSMVEFITDEDIKKEFNKLIDEKQALNKQLFTQTYQAKESRVKAYRKTRIMEEQIDVSDNYRALASETLRRQKMTKCDIFLVDPLWVKAKAKSTSRKQNTPKRPKPAVKPAHLLGFSSDSDDDDNDDNDNDETKDDDQVSVAGFNKDLLNLQYEDTELLEYDDPDEYVFQTDARIAESYASEFNRMDPSDLDYGSNYFFIVAPYNPGDKNLSDNKHLRWVGSIDALTSKHRTQSLKLLDPPHMVRPMKVFFTTWGEVQSCADRTLCDMFSTKTKPKTKPAKAANSAEVSESDSDYDNDLDKYFKYEPPTECPIIKERKRLAALRQSRTKKRDHKSILEGYGADMNLINQLN